MNTSVTSFLLVNEGSELLADFQGTKLAPRPRLGLSQRSSGPLRPLGYPLGLGGCHAPFERTWTYRMIEDQMDEVSCHQMENIYRSSSHVMLDWGFYDVTSAKSQ